MPALQAIADKYNLHLIEDGAQAIGSRFVDGQGKSVKVGTVGIAGCFSFFPSKNLGGIGDGGITVTNDDDFAEKMRVLRNHGAKPRYYHHFIGGNFRLDSIQAAALVVKLPHLESWHRGRQAVAAYYTKGLAGLPMVKTPDSLYPNDHHIYNQYVINVEKRDALMEHLTAAGISTAIYYPVPFHLQPCFAYMGHKKGDFPVSEQAAEHTLALPVYPELTHEQQNYIISAIKEFYKLQG
jgi:dTDP-4-amino-4,6-dideoxygalactose transaminase